MQVRKETKTDYPFYCPRCDENLYRLETINKRELIQRQEQTRNTISEGVVRLYSHNIEWWLDGVDLSLSEVDEQHICAMLENNCYMGELCSTTPNGEEVYGSWNIRRS